MSEEILFTIMDDKKEYPPNDFFFQFDDDEPVLIHAAVKGECSLILKPTGNEVSMEFYQNEKRFRIFFKPIQ